MLTIGLVCPDTNDNEGCPSGQKCTNGICGIADSGLLQGCSTTNLCPGFSVCYSIPNSLFTLEDDEPEYAGYNGEFVPCEPDSKICTCQFFTSPSGSNIGLVNPNALETSVGQTCIDGMNKRESSSNTCYGDEYQPGTSCVSGSINDSGPFLFVLNVPNFQGASCENDECNSGEDLTCCNGICCDPNSDSNRNGIYPTDGMVGVKNFFYTPMQLPDVEISKIVGMSYNYDKSFLQNEQNIDGNVPNIIPDDAKEVLIALTVGKDLYMATYHPGKPDGLPNLYNVMKPKKNIKKLDWGKITFINKEFTDNNGTMDSIIDISVVNKMEKSLEKSFSQPYLYAIISFSGNKNLGVILISLDAGIDKVKPILIINYPKDTSYTYDHLSAYNYNISQTLINNDENFVTTGVWFLVGSTDDYTLMFFNAPISNGTYRVKDTRSKSFEDNDFTKGTLNEIYEVVPVDDGDDTKTLVGLGIFYIDGGKLTVTRLSNGDGKDWKETKVENFVIPNYANTSDNGGHITIRTSNYAIMSTDVNKYKYKHSATLSNTTINGGVFSGDDKLYYMSNGAQIPLPGYFDGTNDSLSMTPTQLYILTQNSC